MAYDSVRAQLDKLLGPERNGPLTEPNSRPVSYSDASVCKHYLLGFCPHDLHIKHRSEPGSCPKQHPPAALAAFTKDRDAGKLRVEIAKWNRALLAECRAILGDEDRKIKNHARRLQESYNASGDLAGLMIRNFDTLKALGMVSRDAQVRILSEMEDVLDVGADEQVADEVSNDSAPVTQADATAKAEAEAEAEIKVAKISPVGKEVGSSASNSDGSASPQIAEEEDDDDLAGFGIIKVIPAEDNAEKLTEAPAADAAPQNDDRKKGTDESKVTGASGEEDEGKLSVERVSTEEKTSQPHCSADGKDVSKSGAAKAKKDRVSNEQLSGALDSAKENTKATKTGEVTDANEASSIAAVSTEGLTEPVDPMERFYETGVGPDGLLMLERKQTLRVCSCCGGFISLVDAESRLLSHFGGKSHHSLVQLREKVLELERTVASEEYILRSAFRRDLSRQRSDDRGSNWSRDNNWRSGGPERYRGRNDTGSERRGHGTNDWYSGASRSHDERYSRNRRDGRDARGGGYDRHSRDERYRDRDRHNGRYDHGRKRHRSRSPDRAGRRSRYRH